MTDTKKILSNVDMCTLDQIRGWVYVPGRLDPAIVELSINGRKLGTIKANKFRSDLRVIREDGCLAFEFQLNLTKRGLLRFLPRKADFTISLPEYGIILNNGMAVLAGKREDHIDDFVNDYGAKYQLNKGAFVIPFTERTRRWKLSVIQLYKRLHADSNKLGYEIFMAYGPLLGAVRNKAFIDHDNDFDCAIVCNGTDIFSITAEFISYLNAMSALGYYYSLDTNGQAHIGHKDFSLDTDFERRQSHQGLNVTLDLFLSWFQNNRLCLTFTIVEGVERQEILPLATIELEGETVPSIRNPEKVLELIYGPGWATPDTSFNWSRGKYITDFFVPIHNYDINKNIEYWQAYYSKDNVSPQFPTQFAIFLLGFLGGRIKDFYTIVEFGCGNGRDSFFFANLGINVISTDYEDSVIAKNSAHEKSKHENKRVLFHKTNIASMSDLELLYSIITNISHPKSRLYYSRFLIHAIDDAAQESLIRFCADVMQDGDLAAFEFRTNSDESGKKLTENHYRRFVDPSAFVQALHLNGLKVRYTVSGYGYANFLDDDAHVARIIFSK